MVFGIIIVVIVLIFVLVVVFGIKENDFELCKNIEKISFKEVFKVLVCND